MLTKAEVDEIEQVFIDFSLLKMEVMRGALSEYPKSWQAYKTKHEADDRWRGEILYKLRSTQK